MSATTNSNLGSHARQDRTTSFSRQVRDALGSLYDLPYLQSHPLASLQTRPLKAGAVALGQMLQRRLLDAIESLRPAEGGPVTRNRAELRYDLVRLRYVEGLAPPVVCERLGMSRSDYYRHFELALRAIVAYLEVELAPASGAGSNQISAGKGFMLPQVGYQTPLVGQVEELGILKAAYDSSASGAGIRIVMITGEQGIGKTRLARELGHFVRVQGGLFLEGRWAAWEGAQPYGAVAEALRKGLSLLTTEEVAHIVGPYCDELARLFPEILSKSGLNAESPALSPEERQLRLYEGVAQAVLGLCQRQPLVLFLDDLHRAPQMNLQLYLIKRLVDCRLVVLYAFREDELVEKPALVAGRNEIIRSRMSTHIGLERLSEAETGQMIAHAFGETAAARLQAPIYAVTRGNPFFVEEVLLHQVENNAVRRVQDGWAVLDESRVGIPESVKLTVRERVARLGEPAVAILQQASVLGREFSVEALSLMAARPSGQMTECLALAITAGVLTDRSLPTTEERYGFRDNHVQEVLYDSIPVARRRRYHMLAGQAIEALYPQRLDELAYHFTHGGDAIKGAAYSCQAAERASSLFLWNRAIPLYQDALDLWEGLGGHVAERAEVAEKLGNVCSDSGYEVDRGTGYLQQALNLYEEIGNVQKAAMIRSQLNRGW